jgi:hypothetical protein
MKIVGGRLRQEFNRTPDIKLRGVRMSRQEIGKHWSGYLQEAARNWLGLADEDIGKARAQLERIVDCVCDRHGVPRTTAELEIYKGLLTLSLGTAPAAANARRNNANP